MSRTRCTWRRPGLTTDNRGRIKVDEHYRTSVEHIYAVGDVIGFPALAATTMDQGRLAAYHAFGEPARELQSLQPIGIYTIPEISFCGKTEEELTTERCPTRSGSRATASSPAARSRRLLRDAEAAGSTDDRTLLGVHVFGTERDGPGAHRPGHDGLRRHRRLPGRHGVQLPHPVRGYKVAALDATNKIRAVNRFANGRSDESPAPDDPPAPTSPVD